MSEGRGAVKPLEQSATETPVRDAWSRWADAAWEFVRRVHLGTRRPGNWIQLFKFGAVGGSGYVINLFVFGLVNGAADRNHIVAAIVAFIVAVSSNFLLNRHWTFAAEAPGAHPAHQGGRFLVVSLFGLAINLVVLEILVGAAGMNGLPAQAIAVAVSMPANYVGNKLWTFR